MPIFSSCIGLTAQPTRANLTRPTTSNASSSSVAIPRPCTWCLDCKFTGRPSSIISGGTLSGAFFFVLAVRKHWLGLVLCPKHLDPMSGWSTNVGSLG